MVGRQVSPTGPTDNLTCLSKYLTYLRLPLRVGCSWPWGKWIIWLCTPYFPSTLALWFVYLSLPWHAMVWSTSTAFAAMQLISHPLPKGVELINSSQTSTPEKTLVSNDLCISTWIHVDVAANYDICTPSRLTAWNEEFDWLVFSHVGFVAAIILNVPNLRVNFFFQDIFATATCILAVHLWNYL